VSAVSFYQLASLSMDIGYWDIFYPQFLQGIGFGMIFVALSTAALSTIEKHRMTSATGLYNVIRQVFGSVGIAIAATQLTSSTTGYHAILAANVNDFRDVATTWVNGLAEAMKGAGAAGANAREMALRLTDAEVFRQAAMLAYNHVFFLVTFVFIVSLPLVLLLQSGGKAEGEAIIE
jgi:DHA2 family multidrug resistance protein